MTKDRMNCLRKCADHRSLIPPRGRFIAGRKDRMAKQARLLYQLKVTLRNIDPKIWRRIQVWEDTTLSQLHLILQIVMGWEDYHLHEFMIGRRLYSVPDVDDDLYERKVIDERRQQLLKVLSRVGAEFQYVYDFGDSWQHDILWEAILL